VGGTCAPGSRTPSGEYAELLHRSISVSERAAEAAVSGDGRDRMFLARQISGLTATLEQIRDGIAREAAAYEQGWRDRESARAAPRLRVVSGG